MEPLLEKLSNEFGSREVQEDKNHQDELNAAPSAKQLSCLGVMSRDTSTFEERLVEILVNAQNTKINFIGIFSRRT